KKELTHVPDNFGAAEVEVLTFKGIPYQVKVLLNGEHRKQLDDRFIDAMTEATLADDNIIFNRKWVSYGTRYGEVEDILTEVYDEIDALYPVERLNSLVHEAKNKRPPEPKVYSKVDIETFKNESDWKKRLYYLDHFDTPTKDDYPLLDF